MKEENTAEREVPEGELGALGELPSKFKSVDALLRAYEALEAEFTRRSQRLRALEEANKAAPVKQEQPSACETLPCEVSEEGERAVRTAPEEGSGAEKPAPSEGIALPRVPLMTRSGAGISAPQLRPKTIEEAGRLALGYLKQAKKGE